MTESDLKKLIEAALRDCPSCGGHASVCDWCWFPRVMLKAIAQEKVDQFQKKLLDRLEKLVVECEAEGQRMMCLLCES